MVVMVLLGVLKALENRNLVVTCLRLKCRSVFLV